MATNIEWTDHTWNPIRGCSRVSAGCVNCYAERQAIRQIKGAYAGLIKSTSHGPAWTGKALLFSDVLERAPTWSGKRPRRIFVNSMSDMFHEALPDEAIMEVLCAIDASARSHQFQILTKRPARMLSLLSRLKPNKRGANALDGMQRTLELSQWPLPNVWIGVSVENQETADERIPLLLQTPAAVRFVSYEPALSAVDFIGPGYFADPTHMQAGGLVGIDWLIVGGESGPGARPCDIAWIRSAVDQCKAAGVPCFVKQFGAMPRKLSAAFIDDDEEFMRLRDRKGGDPQEWPADLRVREFPK